MGLTGKTGNVLLAGFLLAGCSSGGDSEQYPYGKPVDVLYSQAVACAGLKVALIGPRTFSAEPLVTVKGDTEELSQVMISWSTSGADNVTTMLHGHEDLLSPQEHTYKELGTHTVQALILTKDAAGSALFVPESENCKVDIEVK